MIWTIDCLVQTTWSTALVIAKRQWFMREGEALLTGPSAKACGGQPSYDCTLVAQRVTSRELHMRVWHSPHLTEPHDLVVGLASGREVGSSLACKQHQQAYLDQEDQRIHTKFSCLGMKFGESSIASLLLHTSTPDSVVQEWVWRVFDCLTATPYN